MSRIDGAAEVRASYDNALRDVVGRVAAVVGDHGTMLQTRVMARASGRPGPRVRKGDYRRSISFMRWADGSTVTAVIGTNKPQANRLEHGMVGRDSLGRLYNSPPLPHFGPAFEQTAPEFVAALKNLMARYGRTS